MSGNKTKLSSLKKNYTKDQFHINNLSYFSEVNTYVFNRLHIPLL